MKYKSIAIVLATMCLVSACGSNDIASAIEQNDTSETSIKTFEVDGSTVRMQYIDNVKASMDNVETNQEEQELQNEIAETNDENKPTSIGLVTLVGEDNSTDYEVQGDNIIYNGRTFTNLNSVIDRISTAYSRNTVVNWILKCFDYSADEVVIMYVSRYDEVGEDELPFDEQISFDGAIANTSKFDWLLEIHNGTQVISFVGNQTEIYNVDGTPIEIDMSQYVSNTEQTEQTENEEETTDEASEENSNN